MSLSFAQGVVEILFCHAEALFYSEGNLNNTWAPWQQEWMKQSLNGQGFRNFESTCAKV